MSISQLSKGKFAALGLAAIPWIVPALLLLTLALRIARIGDRPVWWDEGWSVWISRQPASEIMRLTASDQHPPLYFALLSVWGSAAGESEAALRLLSAFFGVLTAAGTYALGKAVAGRWAGLLALLLVALSRFSIMWSQEIRMYALSALFAVLGLWAARRVWTRGRETDYLAYIFSMAGGLYTLYMFFPLPLAANAGWLVHWWHERNRREALRWLGAQAAVLLLLAPWAVYAIPRFLNASTQSSINVVDFLKIYWTVLVVGIPMQVEQYYVYTLPVLAVFILCLAVLGWLASRHRKMARDLVMLLAALLIPLLVVFILSQPKEAGFARPFAPRYLVVFAPVYALILGWGIKRIGGKRPLLAFGMTAVVLWAMSSGLSSYFGGRVMKDDYRSLTAILELYRQEDDSVILYTDTDWPIFAYHYPEEWIGVPNRWQIDEARADDFLSPIWGASSGIWLVTTPYAQVSDPQNSLPAWLQERAAVSYRFDYGDNALLYSGGEQSALIGGLRLEDGFSPPKSIVTESDLRPQLAGFQQAVNDYRGGDRAHLFLFWLAGSESTSATFETGWLAADGQQIGGQLMTLPENARPNEGGMIGQQVALPVTADMAEGNFRFYVKLTGRESVTFGRATVRQKDEPVLALTDVTITNPREVSFADNVKLLGYDLDTSEAEPGGTVGLTLYWQAVGPVEGRYKVFTHLLGDVFNIDSGNFLWGQQDNEPVGYARPTTGWLSGEVIVDSYNIPVHPQAPEGIYQIEIGLYDPLNGARLPVLTEAGDMASDFVNLDRLTLSGNR